MTSVGSLVVLAATLLLSEAPARWLPGPGASPGDEALALLALIGLLALVQLPFDLLGGRLLPQRFGRSVPTWPGYLAGWLRGVLVQGALLFGAGQALLRAGRDAGTPGALATAAALMLLLLALQPLVARLVARLDQRPAPDLLRAELAALTGSRASTAVWSSADEGFTGGWLGLPGVETLVLPERWVEQLPPDALRATLVQRAEALASGARTRGVLLALAFNLTGLWLASLLPGAGFDSLAALACTSLGATLWGFLGLLLLPTLSRRAVLAVDALTLRHVGAGSLQRALRQIDRWRDDEPSRAPLVETIFHPVPSVTARITAAEQAGPRAPGAWHVVRTMLYLSWGSLGLLGRAVHCNSGRPALWVALPTD